MAESFFATSPDFLSPLETLSPQKSKASEGPDFEARYKALIEHIPGVIFVAPLRYGSGDAYVSPQIETILGFTQEEWLEDPLRWYQQVHPADKERWSIEAASLFLSGKPLSSSYRVMARDGRVVWFQCDARMVHSSDGQPSFIHGVGFDVTALKETEASLERARNELETRVEERTHALGLANEQLKREIAGHLETELLLIAAKDAAESAMRLKGEFMANMSHEIRTPMNGILGLTSLVLNTELTAGQREQLTLVHSSAESLLSIVNQVLDFSSMASGQTELHPARFRLKSSVAILVKELAQQAKQRSLNLTHSISPEAPDDLVGDLGRLRQVLTNLIGNAIKFTQAGSVHLEIGLDGPLQLPDKRSCVLRFSVIDTGIGIPASKTKEIFEPFLQADGSLSREYGGGGLGLAISKALVGLMGGRIEVTSAPGRGSTFSFTAVFETAVKTPEVGPAGPANAAPGSRSGLRVLIAEDNLVNQMVVVGVMEHFGHIVKLAANGREAVDAYRGSPFDVVLMDVQMPLMDGLAATQAIRALEVQGSAHLPIIGLSAHALESDRALCLEAGMDSYLSKPFKPRELMALIEELVARYAEVQ